jgi:hypothetical protein
MFVLKFGSRSNEYVEICLSFPSCDKHGFAWVQTEATLVVENFRGSIQPMFEINDFLRFAPELRKVYETLSGKATFDSREQQLFFTVSGNGRGSISVEGYAYSQATYGNKLEFELTMDQTFLPEPLAVLEQISQEWDCAHNHA